MMIITQGYGEQRPTIEPLAVAVTVTEVISVAVTIE